MPDDAFVFRTSPSEPRRQAMLSETARWPVSHGALAALVDLGMSDGTIAAYFQVQPRDVAALKSQYGV